eukprot:9640262-Karenia_brevis.AAC.1
MLSVLYKVFSKLIGNRIAGLLDRCQPPDQAGFRPGYSCDDHLFTVGQVLERAEEYQISVWAAAVDFQKAFDTVEHCKLWESLIRMGVPS